MQQNQRAIIALGGNLPSVWGAPAETLQRALVELAHCAQGAVKHSRFFRTPAFPAGAGPEFVNAVAVIETALSPQDLLDMLHRIEAQALRARGVRWGQRTLDLDLVAVEQQVLPDRDTLNAWITLPLDQQMIVAPDTLLLPHPRLQDRAFVLVPLAEVAPDWRHPILGKTVAQMCDDLPVTDKQSVQPIETP